MSVISAHKCMCVGVGCTECSVFWSPCACYSLASVPATAWPGCKMSHLDSGPKTGLKAQNPMTFILVGVPLCNL